MSAWSLLARLDALRRVTPVSDEAAGSLVRRERELLAELAALPAQGDAVAFQAKVATLCGLVVVGDFEELQEALAASIARDMGPCYGAGVETGNRTDG